MNDGRRGAPVALRLAASLALTAAVWLPSPAPAPAQTGPGLDPVEAAADSGELESARRLLSDWLESQPLGEADGEIARARFLRARLSRDLDSAEVDYLWVAVQGEEPYAAPARLRLAQLRAARGDLDRADHDLDRLRADFPDSPWVLSSWLWSGNVRLAAGDRAKACEAWTEALKQPGHRETAADHDLASAALSHCGSAGDGSPAEAAFTVQLGAFRSRDAALDLRDRAAEIGVAVRVIEPSGAGGLYRVRSGRFASREEAARRAIEMGSAGFEAIVVPEDS